MQTLIEILSNRRVWAAAVGISGFLIGVMGMASNYDSETLINLLANLGQALAALIPAALALWSYLRPKKEQTPK